MRRVVPGTRMCCLSIVLAGACGTDPAPAQVDHAAAGHGVAQAPAAGGHSAELAFLFPDGDDRGWAAIRAISDKFHTGAHGAPPLEASPATRAELVRQLNLTSRLVQQYPTVSHAEAAGYRRAGPYSPGFGAHWQGGLISSGGPLTDEEILHPSSLLFGGTAPDAQLVGFMYTAQGPNPVGFAGEADRWHGHVDVCSKAGKNGVMESLGADGVIGKSECERLGFTFSEERSLPMLHVWTVPAYTNPLGVFSHENPAVKCKDGSYHISTDWGDFTYLSNRCKAR
ncbi:MAG: hypothetical protein IPL75_19775 [Acidobacteria bacterium]|nr:hypothetical protein [Acidobacteriota bacterium]